MKKKSKGFIELLVVIIVALLLMRYLGITVSGVINWFTAFFRSVLR
jgi:hypothetical protein